MMDATGGFSVRTFLRAILSIALLLGGGLGDWSVGQAQSHASCCCGMSAGPEDSCPCPKPEGNRAPARGACADRQAVVAPQASLRKAEQGQRRTEARPEPATWAKSINGAALSSSVSHAFGRDPDLGRHLARLQTYRI